MQGNIRGPLYVLLGGFLFSLMALLIKVQASNFDSVQLAWFRALFGFMTLLLFVPSQSLASLKPKYPRTIVMRALFGVAALLCSFYSFSHLPIDTATAITFTRPLFVVPLAYYFLSEHTSRGRLLAMLVGFAGIAIALQPSAGDWLPASIGIIGAFLVATVSIQVKKMTVTDTVFTITIYNELLSALIILPLAVLVWKPITPEALPSLACIGVLGAMGQMSMAKGLKLSEATTATSFDYFRFIFSVILSMVFLGTSLSLILVIGAALIALSGFYIQYERQIGVRLRNWISRTEAPR